MINERFNNAPPSVRDNVVELGFDVIDRLVIIQRNKYLEDTYDQTIGGGKNKDKNTKNYRKSIDCIVEKNKSKWCNSLNLIIKEETRNTI
jgi:hypothetical protein